MIFGPRCAPWIALALAGGFASSARADASTAFFYGAPVPRELSVAYDQLVLEPAHSHDVKALKQGGAKLIAYVSIGEIAKTSADAKLIAPGWELGANDDWASKVLDVSHAGYRAHLQARVAALLAAGYDGVFLDTLDSYQLVAKTDAERARMRMALCSLIASFADAHPKARILLNRGFELLPSIAKRVHGVVAESLFDRYVPKTNSYARVPEGDRAWLLDRLREARNDHGLPVIVIDYRPAHERDAARATARKIAALGFTPWVTQGALMSVGVGAVEILPRRVLLLTKQPEHAVAAADQLEPSDAERFVAPVLEHLGYVPERVELSASGFAALALQGPLTGRYAGIVAWLAGDAPSGYAEWVVQQTQAGVPWVAIGSLGFDATGAAGKVLGVRTVGEPLTGEPRGAIVARDALIGFEAEPSQAQLDSAALAFDGKQTRVHLQLRDRLGRAGAAIATTDFGGVILSHAFATRGLHGERAWVLDPFAFFSSALRLPVAPQPDITTAQGRRVGLFIVRVEGLGERARLRGRPPVSRVLERELLSQHAYAHALELTRDVGEADASAARALRERFSGGHALELLDAGVLAPGETATRSDSPSLTTVFPMALVREGRLHVLSPTALDAHYVGDAAESYPYARALETFERTGSPRRLTPIALHYHAYALASLGGLQALQRLYGWADQNQIFSITAAEHVARVAAFRSQVLLRGIDGSFELKGGEALATVRVPVELGALDTKGSRGVAGEHLLAQGRYVGFVPHGPRRLVFTAQKATPL